MADPLKNDNTTQLVEIDAGDYVGLDNKEISEKMAAEYTDFRGKKLQSKVDTLEQCRVSQVENNCSRIMGNIEVFSMINGELKTSSVTEQSLSLMQQFHSYLTPDNLYGGAGELLKSKHAGNYEYMEYTIDSSNYTCKLIRELSDQILRFPLDALSVLSMARAMLTMPSNLLSNFDFAPCQNSLGHQRYTKAKGLTENVEDLDSVDLKGKNRRMAKETEKNIREGLDSKAADTLEILTKLQKDRKQVMDGLVEPSNSYLYTKVPAPTK